MSLQLHCKTADLHKTLTAFYLYPTLLEYDGLANRWRSRNTSLKMWPLLFNTFIIQPLCIFPGLFYFITLLQQGPTKFLNSHKDVFKMALCMGFSLLEGACLLINLLQMRYSREGSVNINQLIELEHQISGRHSCKALSWKEYLTIIMAESKKALQGKRFDVVVLFLFYYIWFTVGNNIVIPPVLVYLQSDPLFTILPEALTHNGLFVLVLIIRLVVTMSAILECGRSMSLMVLVASMYICHLRKLIQAMLTKRLSVKAVKLYKTIETWKLQYDGMYRFIVAASMLVGFSYMIMCNVNMFVGWKIIPLPLYIISLPITPLTLELTDYVLRKIVQFYEGTSTLVRRTWFLETISCKFHENKVMVRTLRGVRPISFYCAHATIIDSDTRQSYYMFIFTHTVNVLLFVKDKIDVYTKVHGL